MQLHSIYYSGMGTAKQSAGAGSNEINEVQGFWASYSKEGRNRVVFESNL
jgi:hypothetical protein